MTLTGPLDHEPKVISQPLFLNVLHQDHANFLHLLIAFEKQVGEVESNHRPSHHILEGVLHYFAEYARLVHHPREEMLIEILKKKEVIRETHIREIVEDHRALAERISTLETALSAFISNPASGSHSFIHAARQFIAAEKQHISAEELYLFSAASALLSASEWEWLNSGLADADDPLFGEVVTAPFARLRKSILATDHAFADQHKQRADPRH